MGNELFTATGHQDWSEEHVKALFDRFVALPSPPPGAPSSNLSIGAPENASHPSDSLDFPGTVSLTFFHTLPILPTQHPSVVALIPGGPASSMQAASVPVPHPTSLEMGLVDLLSLPRMPPSSSAQTPILHTDAIWSLTSIPQDGHPHVPGVAHRLELTSLGTETPVASGGSLSYHLLYGWTVSSTPGFSAGMPIYQPIPDVDQVSVRFVSMPSAKVCLTHRALCLCRDTAVNASAL